MTDTEKADLEAYVKRGGGLVTFHDTLCGPDPAYYATLVGGAKKHGETNFTLEAEIPYTIVDKANPIMQGMSDFTIKEDEAFYSMTWATNPEDQRAGQRQDCGNAERGDRGPCRRSRAADVDVRAHACRRNDPGTRVRVDAGTRPTSTSRIPSSSPCCCAASPGRPRGRWTSLRATSRPRAGDGADNRHLRTSTSKLETSKLELSSEGSR